jgi:hypothetical protein
MPEWMMPEPMTCPACGEATDWVWDDDLLASDPPDYTPKPEWALDGEWWHSPADGIPYADTYYCLARLRRGMAPSA